MRKNFAATNILACTDGFYMLNRQIIIGYSSKSVNSAITHKTQVSTFLNRLVITATPFSLVNQPRIAVLQRIFAGDIRHTHTHTSDSTNVLSLMPSELFILLHINHHYGLQCTNFDNFQFTTKMIYI
jgi:hypothetical protein